MRIELHPDAAAEFAAQVHYYDDAEPGLGQRFYREVLSSLGSISANPTLPRLRKNHRRVNLRTFRFYIAYVVEEGLVRVLAVAHGHRRPGYWMERRSGG